MSDSNKDRASNWMERETLAKHLEHLLEKYDVKYRGHGRIYINHEHYNILTAEKIISDLRTILGVSKDLIRSRLIELGWLNDVRLPIRAQDGAALFIEKLESFAADELEENDPETDEEDVRY